MRRAFSSRKLEQATYDSVAFRFIACASDHYRPRHDRGVPAAVSDRDRSAVRSRSCCWHAEMGVPMNWSRWTAKIRADAGQQARFPRRRRQDRSATEGGNGCTAGQTEAADAADVPRRDVDSRRTGAARGACGKSLRRARRSRRAPRSVTSANLPSMRPNSRRGRPKRRRQARSWQASRRSRRLPGRAEDDQSHRRRSRIMPVAGGGFDQC